jgi:hypothetical protein
MPRLDPIVAKPQFFPKFEAAVEAVMRKQLPHQKSRVGAFYTVLDVAKAVPEVAAILDVTEQVK